MRKLFLLGVLALLGFHVHGAEDGPRPPWLQPAVLKAAGSLQLTQAQMPQFNQAVTDLVNNRLRAINKLLRKNNQLNLSRKMKSATNKSFKKMDKQMGEFLSESQYAAYQDYRSALKDSTLSADRSRARSSADAMNSAGAALNGNSNSQ